MSVKRISGRWRYRCVVERVDGTKIRISGSAPSYEDTKQQALLMERAHAERERMNVSVSGTEGAPNQATPITEPAKPEVPTITEFLNTYLASASLINKPSSMVSKGYLLRLHIVPWLGHLRLDEVSYAAIEDFKISLVQKRAAHVKALRLLSPKTVNNALVVLSHMLQTARKRGLIESVPDIDWLKGADPEFDFLSFDEAANVIAGADGEWRTMIMVALRTGMRRGELLALRWQDVDLSAGRLTVRQNYVSGQFGTPKSGKAREIALGEDVIAVIRAHRHERGPLVFCDAEGKVLTRGALARPLIRACEAAKLGRAIGWHTLRHSFASHLVMLGVSMRAVQELLGHAHIQMTERYAHLAPQVARDAVRLLDKAHRDPVKESLKQPARIDGEKATDCQNPPPDLASN